MPRVIFAFILAPISALVLYGIVTGSLGIIFVAFGIVYLLMLVLVLPLFLLCIKLKWLKWWYAAIAGIAISIAFTWLLAVSSNPYHIEIYGISDLFSYLTIGYTIAVFFWAMAVYRNEKFTYVSRKFPWSALGVLILLVAGNLYIQSVTRTAWIKGRIVTELPPVGSKPMVKIRLNSGKTVQARIMCYSTYSIGNLVNLDYRPRSLLFKDGYWVEDVVTDSNTFNQTTWMTNATKCYDEMLQRMHKE